MTSVKKTLRDCSNFISRKKESIGVSGYNMRSKHADGYQSDMPSTSEVRSEHSRNSTRLGLPIMRTSRVKIFKRKPANNYNDGLEITTKSHTFPPLSDRNAALSSGDTSLATDELRYRRGNTWNETEQTIVGKSNGQTDLINTAENATDLREDEKQRELYKNALKTLQKMESELSANATRSFRQPRNNRRSERTYHRKALSIPKPSLESITEADRENSFIPLRLPPLDSPRSVGLIWEDLGLPDGNEHEEQTDSTHDINDIGSDTLKPNSSRLATYDTIHHLFILPRFHHKPIDLGVLGAIGNNSKLKLKEHLRALGQRRQKLHLPKPQFSSKYE